MEQLMLLGGFVPLPFVLYSIIQTLRKHPHANLFGLLLAYLAVLIPVGVFAWGTARQTLPAMLTLIIVSSAAVTALFGLVLLVRELRSSSRKVSRSYGLLGVGVSLLLVVGLIATPTIFTFIPNATVSAANTGAFPAFGAAPVAPGSTDVAAGATDTSGTGTTTNISFPAAPAGFEAPVGFAAVESTQEADATVTPAATATEVPTRAPVRQAVLPTITPTLAVTATPFVIATATPATAAASCDLLTIYNLNLRAEPNAEAQLITTIPYGTTVTAYEVNTDGWWRVQYAGQAGWVNGEYVSAATACIALTGD